jgi:hypothetical protein
VILSDLSNYPVKLDWNESERYHPFCETHSDSREEGIAMARLVRFESPWPADPPKDPLDRIALILTLMIIWRLVGGC